MAYMAVRWRAGEPELIYFWVTGIVILVRSVLSGGVNVD